jgi:AcrR family transcriptional regulator
MTDESGAVATEIESGPLPEGSTDGARPMRADARRNYEALIAAARLVFAQHGGGASMEAIAKEAGVGPGTLYRHFPTRIDLVEAVYREDVDKLVSDAQQFVAEQEPWDAIVSWLQAFVRYASSKRTFLSELHEAFEKNPS